MKIARKLLIALLAVYIILVPAFAVIKDVSLTESAAQLLAAYPFVIAIAVISIFAIVLFASLIFETLLDALRLIVWLVLPKAKGQAALQKIDAWWDKVLLKISGKPSHSDHIEGQDAK